MSEKKTMMDEKEKRLGSAQSLPRIKMDNRDERPLDEVVDHFHDRNRISCSEKSLEALISHMKESYEICGFEVDRKEPERVGIIKRPDHWELFFLIDIDDENEKFINGFGFAYNIREKNGYWGPMHIPLELPRDIDKNQIMKAKEMIFDSQGKIKYAGIKERLSSEYSDVIGPRILARYCRWDQRINVAKNKYNDIVYSGDNHDSR